MCFCEKSVFCVLEPLVNFCIVSALSLLIFFRPQKKNKRKNTFFFFFFFAVRHHFFLFVSRGETEARLQFTKCVRKVGLKAQKSIRSPEKKFFFLPLSLSRPPPLTTSAAEAAEAPETLLHPHRHLRIPSLPLLLLLRHTAAAEDSSSSSEASASPPGAGGDHTPLVAAEEASSSTSEAAAAEEASADGQTRLLLLLRSQPPWPRA